MSLYRLVSFLAAVSFFIPILLLLAKRLIQNKTLIWFGLYWCWNGLVNLACSIEMFEQLTAAKILVRLYNLADIPLTLFILYTTTPVAGIKKSLKKILLPLLCVEIATAIISLFTNAFEMIVVFAGVLLVLYYVLWTIIAYSQKKSFSQWHTSYQYIYYALLFEYATAVITVIYSYIIPQKANTDERFAIFYISIIIAIATASAGILTYREKEKSLQKIKKQQSRSELEIKYL
jgi:hypothetical protein